MLYLKLIAVPIPSAQPAFSGQFLANNIPQFEVFQSLAHNISTLRLIGGTIPKLSKETVPKNKINDLDFLITDADGKIVETLLQKLTKLKNLSPIGRTLSSVGESFLYKLGDIDLSFVVQKKGKVYPASWYSLGRSGRLSFTATPTGRYPITYPRQGEICQAMQAKSHFWTEYNVYIQHLGIRLAEREVKGDIGIGLMDIRAGEDSASFIKDISKKKESLLFLHLLNPIIKHLSELTQDAHVSFVFRYIARALRFLQDDSLKEKITDELISYAKSIVTVDPEPETDSETDSDSHTSSDFSTDDNPLESLAKKLDKSLRLESSKHSHLHTLNGYPHKRLLADAGHLLSYWKMAQDQTFRSAFKHDIVILLNTLLQSESDSHISLKNLLKINAIADDIGYILDLSMYEKTFSYIIDDKRSVKDILPDLKTFFLCANDTNHELSAPFIKTLVPHLHISQFFDSDATKNYIRDVYEQELLEYIVDPIPEWLDRRASKHIQLFPPNRPSPFLKTYSQSVFNRLLKKPDTVSTLIKDIASKCLHLCLDTALSKKENSPDTFSKFSTLISILDHAQYDIKKVHTLFKACAQLSLKKQKKDFLSLAFSWSLRFELSDDALILPQKLVRLSRDLSPTLGLFLDQLDFSDQHFEHPLYITVASLVHKDELPHHPPRHAQQLLKLHISNLLPLETKSDNYLINLSEIQTKDTDTFPFFFSIKPSRPALVKHLLKQAITMDDTHRQAVLTFFKETPDNYDDSLTDFIHRLCLVKNDLLGAKELVLFLKEPFSGFKTASLPLNYPQHLSIEKIDTLFSQDDFIGQPDDALTLLLQVHKNVHKSNTDLAAYLLSKIQAQYPPDSPLQDIVFYHLLEKQIPSLFRYNPSNISLSDSQKRRVIHSLSGTELPPIHPKFLASIHPESLSLLDTVQLCIAGRLDNDSLDQYMLKCPSLVIKQLQDRKYPPLILERVETAIEHKIIDSKHLLCQHFSKKIPLPLDLSLYPNLLRLSCLHSIHKDASEFQHSVMKICSKIDSNTAQASEIDTIKKRFFSLDENHQFAFSQLHICFSQTKTPQPFIYFMFKAGDMDFISALIKIGCPPPKGDTLITFLMAAFKNDDPEALKTLHQWKATFPSVLHPVISDGSTDITSLTLSAITFHADACATYLLTHPSSTHARYMIEEHWLLKCLQHGCIQTAQVLVTHPSLTEEKKTNHTLTFFSIFFGNLSPFTAYISNPKFHPKNKKFIEHFPTILRLLYDNGLADPYAPILVPQVCRLRTSAFYYALESDDQSSNKQSLFHLFIQTFNTKDPPIPNDAMLKLLTLCQSQNERYTLLLDHCLQINQDLSLPVFQSHPMEMLPNIKGHLT